MQEMFSPCSCQQSSMRPAAPGYVLYGQVPVYLGGKAGTERVVLYKSVNGPAAKAEIQKFDEAANRWTVEYRKEAEGVPYFLVLTGYWETTRHNVVILYTVTGSGGILNYTVLGRSRGKLVTYAERKDIFQGDLWFEGGRLIEAGGNRYKTWIQRRGQLLLVRYNIPAVPGALVIEYAITQDGTVKISKTNYTIPTGATVQILRTDENPVNERILFYMNTPGTPAIKFIRHRSAYKFTGRGKQELTIIPGGYDWGKAVNITIEFK